MIINTWAHHHRLSLGSTYTISPFPHVISSGCSRLASHSLKRVTYAKYGSEDPHQALVQSWLTLICPSHSHPAMGHCSSVPSHEHSVLKPPGQIMGIGLILFWQNQVGSLNLNVHNCGNLLKIVNVKPWIRNEYFIVLADQLTALGVCWSVLRQLPRQHAEEGRGAVIIHKQLAPAFPACSKRVLAKKWKVWTNVFKIILFWKCICPPYLWMGLLEWELWSDQQFQKYTTFPDIQIFLASWCTIFEVSFKNALKILRCS